MADLAINIRISHFDPEREFLIWIKHEGRTFGIIIGRAETVEAGCRSVMPQDDQTSPEPRPSDDAPRTQEARRVVEEYVLDLKAILKKLRKLFNSCIAF